MRIIFPSIVSWSAETVEIGFMNPVVNSDVTPIDPELFEILTYLSGRYTG